MDKSHEFPEIIGAIRKFVAFVFTQYIIARAQPEAIYTPKTEIASPSARTDKQGVDIQP